MFQDYTKPRMRINNYLVFPIQNNHLNEFKGGAVDVNLYKYAILQRKVDKNHKSWRIRASTLQLF